EQHSIFAAPQAIHKDVTTAGINRVPEPPRLAFLAHVGPHLIDFRVLNALDHHVHLVRRQGVEERLGHRGERRLFFSRVANLTREGVIARFPREGTLGLRGFDGWRGAPLRSMVAVSPNLHAAAQAPLCGPSSTDQGLVDHPLATVGCATLRCPCPGRASPCAGPARGAATPADGQVCVGTPPPVAGGGPTDADLGLASWGARAPGSGAMALGVAGSGRASTQAASHDHGPAVRPRSRREAALGTTDARAARQPSLGTPLGDGHGGGASRPGRACGTRGGGASPTPGAGERPGGPWGALVVGPPADAPEPSARGAGPPAPDGPHRSGGPLAPSGSGVARPRATNPRGRASRGPGAPGRGTRGRPQPARSGS